MSFKLYQKQVASQVTEGNLSRLGSVITHNRSRLQFSGVLFTLTKIKSNMAVLAS